MKEPWTTHKWNHWPPHIMKLKYFSFFFCWRPRWSPSRTPAPHFENHYDKPCPRSAFIVVWRKIVVYKKNIFEAEMFLLYPAVISSSHRVKTHSQPKCWGVKQRCNSLSIFSLYLFTHCQVHKWSTDIKNVSLNYCFKTIQLSILIKNAVSCICYNDNVPDIIHVPIKAFTHETIDIWSMNDHAVLQKTEHYNWTVVLPNKLANECLLGYSNFPAN